LWRWRFLNGGREKERREKREEDKMKKSGKEGNGNARKVV